MVAALGGHLDTVKLLVARGADVKAKDDEDMTGLLNAVKGNFGDVASALVEAGSNPDDPFVDDSGNERNLLLDAVMVENEKFAKLLIENDANVNYKVSSWED